MDFAIQPHLFKNATKTPIVSVISVILAIVFFSEFPNVKCSENGLQDIMMNTLRHGGIHHLLSNVISFFYLSHLERSMGPLKFGSSILFLMVVTSVLHLLIKTRRCSVGFSGVLFGLLTYDFLKKRGKNLNNIGLIIMMHIVPHLGNTRLSHLGHLYGIIAGALMHLIF